MNKNLLYGAMALIVSVVCLNSTYAQITKVQDFENKNSPFIGTFQGISFREAGFSTLFPIPNTDGKEFWTLTDRGVNVDAANANGGASNGPCKPTYDKIFAFKDYSPKIFRVRLNGDSIQIIQTITIKRPDKTTTRGVLNPTGFGSTAAEEVSTDTVLNCNNFASKKAAKDTFALDPEGLAVDAQGNFWVSEENGPTVWKINKNGVLVKRFTPYANLSGAKPQDSQIDTCFKYRKNNRGFESLTIAPNGKIYTVIQSPLLYPTKTVGEATRVHRILEIDPATNAMRMLAYLNDGVIGASGSNQIRLRDWKLSDMAAINDSTFLVVEVALRGTTDIKRIYQININNATPINSGLYGGKTAEALVDSIGLAGQGLKAVKKTIFMDLIANGWPAALEKSEGLAILNDSTIFVGNDNDYGQVSLPEDGLAMATGITSHIIKYGLKGTNKIKNLSANTSPLTQGKTGQSSSQTPYMLSTIPDAQYTAILTAGDNVGGYKMVGLPDGVGAYDNNNGTFTVLINHEISSGSGITRAHGNKGAFVSKFVINKADLAVQSGEDLIKNVQLFDTTTSTFVLYNNSVNTGNPKSALGRFCSADLPVVSAFYNSATGKGTKERIFMNGEESGVEGRAFGHIVTGAEAGTTYELPYLGKYSWENSVANPRESDTTVVVGMDDATPGQVYFYMGTKTNSGTDIEKAGLHNGNVYAPAVVNLLSESNTTADTVFNFTMKSLGNVSKLTGAKLQANSNVLGVTQFLRPEDGVWDPNTPTDFYFATTNSFTAPSRLWRMRFKNAADITQGGTIQAVLNGTEGPKMIDNITIDNNGKLILVEDVGGQSHLGKVWQYTAATDVLKLIGTHDSTRFINGSSNFITQDEEASGTIDVQSILGEGMFITVDQAHAANGPELVEFGQLLAFNNPDTKNNNPEVLVSGNGNNVLNGDISPSTTDNTDFNTINTGKTTSQTFTIENNGVGNLVVRYLKVRGADASQFKFVSAPVLPLTIAPNGTSTVTVQFAPTTDGIKTAQLIVENNDFDETHYTFDVKGTAVSPEVNVKGNNLDIANGDITASEADFTDFDTLNTNTTTTKTFVIQNKGEGLLTVSDIKIIGLDSLSYNIVSAPAFPLSLQAVTGTQNITVSFAPTTDGVKNAKVQILNDDANEANYIFAIKGTAGTPEVNVLGNNVSIVDGASTPLATNNTDFGAVDQGANTNKSFVIQNTGVGVLTVSNIAISGANASDFTLVSAPSFPLTLASGASTTINARFTPSAVGVRNATLTITNNDANEAAYDFALRGTGNIINSLNAIIALNNIKLYPNPSENLTTLTFNNKKEENVSVRIYDVTGKLILNVVEQNFAAGEQKVELNTSKLPSGNYLVNILIGTNIANINMVVAR